MAKIRVGMIGAGAIANDHCNGVLKHAQGEVVAVADMSAERAQEVAKKFNFTKTYSKWEDLIADKEIDAVCVALPNYLHAPVSLAALKAGKHVLLDKPFALSLKEAKSVADAAKKAKKTMMVGMNQRYRTESQTIRALVERGELGEVYHGKAKWLRRSGCPRFGTWFGEKKFAGGGAMLDIGVHMLDLCLFLMDNWKPVCVTGQTYTKFGNRGLGEGGWGKSDRKKNWKFDVDDFAAAFIKFKNGASVELNVSWALHQAEGNVWTMDIFGTEAGATAIPAAKLYRYNKKQPGEYEVVEPQGVKLAKPQCSRQYDWIDAILGNGNDTEVLPIVEIQFQELPSHINPIYSFEAKWIWDTVEKPLEIFACPAKISLSLRKKIEQVCRAAFASLRVRDWCRIDVRLDEEGRPQILELNPLPGILPDPDANSCFPKAARTAGLSYEALVNRVLDIACRRAGLSP